MDTISVVRIGGIPLAVLIVGSAFWIVRSEDVRLQEVFREAAEGPSGIGGSGEGIAAGGPQPPIILPAFLMPEARPPVVPFRGHPVSLEDFGALALTEVRQIEENHHRGRILREIAVVQAKVRLTAEALETFEEAWTTRDGISCPALALRSLAVAHAEAGLTEWARDIFGAALEAAEQMPLQPDRESVVRDIAASQARAGLLEEALTTARGIVGTAERDRALSSIILVQSGRHRFAEALETAASVDDEFCRAQVLTEIAVLQVTAGLAKEADETFEEALATAAAIPFRGVALRGTVDALAKAERFDEALTVIGDIRDPFAQAPPLGIVAVSQAKRGRFQEALATANRIRHGYHRSSAHGVLAVAQARAGEFEAALALAEEIPMAPMRAQVLCEIAAAQARAGRPDQARETFRAARTTVERMPGLNLVLHDIAVSQAKVGMFEEALGATRGIGRFTRASALREIAAAQTGAGQEASVLSWAEKEQDVYARALCYVGVYESLCARHAESAHD